MAFSALAPVFAKAAPFALDMLMSRIGAGAAHGRQKQLERMYSPGWLGASANEYFNQFKASPFYSALRNAAMTGSQRLASGLNASFYRRGLGTSGIAATALPLAQSSFQNSFNQIDADLFSKSLSQAENTRTALAGGMQPEIGAGTWGHFLDSAGPGIREMIMQLLQGMGRPRGYAGQTARQPGGGILLPDYGMDF